MLITISNIMSNQAAWLDGKGKKLRVAEAPKPKLAAGEILIANKAIAVNPVSVNLARAPLVR